MTRHDDQTDSTVSSRPNNPNIFVETTLKTLKGSCIIQNCVAPTFRCDNPRPNRCTKNIAIETKLNHGNGWASGPEQVWLQQTVRVEREMVFATSAIYIIKRSLESQRGCWSMLRSKNVVLRNSCSMWIVCILVWVTPTLTDLYFPLEALVPLFFAPFFRPSSVSTGLMFKTNEHVYMIYMFECRQTNTGHCLLNEHVNIFCWECHISMHRNCRKEFTLCQGHPDLLTNNH